ncbi:MAG TPA: hypothetical protein VLQ65_09825 [Saliniramus sp.]|nr:hypothetical protein [Saliniramus sp.]
MENMVFNVGNGMCWGFNAFLDSQVCSTRTHEMSVGYLSFALLAVFIAWTLMKRLNRA